MKKNLKTIHNPMVKFEYDKSLFGKSTDVRIYHDATLITPGVFSDSITMSPVKYSEDVLSTTVNKWHSNYLNINHSRNVLDRIGRVVNPYYSDGRVKGDLYIFPVTQNARDTIELIDEGLINWLSVELITEDSWDRNDERYVSDLKYMGVAVVTEPACSNAKIDESGADFDLPTEV